MRLSQIAFAAALLSACAAHAESPPVPPASATKAAYAKGGQPPSAPIAAPGLPATPVQMRIQVIEASRKKKGFPKTIAGLAANMPGHSGASLLYDFQTEVSRGAALSLDIKKKKMSLEVKVLNVADTGDVQLHVAIAALKLSAKTTHRKGNATFMVGKAMGPEESLFLAVTPRL